MSAHTPGPGAVMTYHAACGCRIVPGNMPMISHCPRHAAAPRMLDDVLTPLAEYADLIKQHYPELIGLVKAALAARAILRDVEGESNG